MSQQVGSLRLNSHGWHVSGYQTFVLALCVAEVDCNLQLAACLSGRKPAVAYADKIAEDYYFSRE